jgi:hypothetical protein
MAGSQTVTNLAVCLTRNFSTDMLCLVSQKLFRQLPRILKRGLGKETAVLEAADSRNHHTLFHELNF